MKLLKIFTICFVFIFINGCFLFSQNRDAKIWTNFKIEKKITKKFSLELSEELRLFNNVSEAESFFTDFGVVYKHNKYIKFSINYRFLNKRLLNDNFSMRHRYYVDLSLKKKYKRVIASLRTRFQSQYKDVYRSDNWQTPNNYFRNKVNFEIDLDKKYTPYLNVELFYQLNNNKGNVIDNVRYSVGFDYEINKKVSWGLFYMYEQEYNVKNPFQNFIGGLNFVYTL